MKWACLGSALLFSTIAGAQAVSRRPVGPIQHRPQSSFSGVWQRTSTNPPAGVGEPILLTDGTVLCHRPQTSSWYKLTPTAAGTYQDGTWSTVATMQSGYGPLYFASGVLPDGRLVVIGGEYNTGSSSAVWTNKGSVYNPVANTWTSLAAPSGWTQIGDAQSQVLPDGRFLLAHPFDKQMAVLNPTTMAWTSLLGTGKGDRFDEEGWVLMPDGTILTADAINSPHAEKYIPWLDTWMSAGDTPAKLEDAGSQELGPMILMPNGKVFAFGATGHNAIYTPGATATDPGSWAAAPDFPNVGGQLDIADGPAVLMPNGRILAYASPGVFKSPSHFYEWDGTSLLEVANVPNSASNPSYVGNFLILPNGQIMFTDLSQDVEIYTPANNVPNDTWRPTITSCPSGVLRGQSYTVGGTQFNGLSNGSSYGDDSTNNTNYPLVRIRNTGTGHVKYCRTHDHSTMALGTGSLPVSTTFDVPANIELGQSTIEVVCNGIASFSRTINVGVKVAPTTFSIVQGAFGTGTVASLFAIDTDLLVANSAPVSGGKQIQVMITGTSPVLNPISLSATVAAKVSNSGPTDTIYMFNYVDSVWEAVNSRIATTTEQTSTGVASGTLSRFVNQTNGEIKLLVGYGNNPPQNAKSWSASLNLAIWTINQ